MRLCDNNFLFLLLILLFKVIINVIDYSFIYEMSFSNWKIIIVVNWEILKVYVDFFVCVEVVFVLSLYFF